jgi:outer membrane protein
MKRSIIRLCCLCLLLLPIALSNASSPTPSNPTPVTLPHPLELDEVLRRVRLYHPKLKGAELARQLAGAKRLEKQGAFDPQLTVDSMGQRYNSTSKPGDAKSEWLNEATITTLTRYGAKVGIGGRLNTGDFKII